MGKLPTYEEVRAKLEATTFEEFKERFNKAIISAHSREYLDFKDLCYFYKFKITPVCAFDIQYNIYRDSSYNERIIQTLYTKTKDKNSFDGVMIKIVFD